MNLGTPIRGRVLAGQQLGKETENDQVKAEAALPGVPLHDPVKYSLKSLAGKSDRESLVVGWLVKVKCRIVKITIRWEGSEAPS